jgi:cellulose synthase/poly-beta-1,6-N-acetylglucosamine synthase-like glycosyltransferase
MYGITVKGNFSLPSPSRGIAPPLSGDPFVSVILAIRNEANFIERTLSAILEQDFPSERMEVLIADGMAAARVLRSTSLPGGRRMRAINMRARCGGLIQKRDELLHFNVRLPETELPQIARSALKN